MFKILLIANFCGYIWASCPHMMGQMRSKEIIAEKEKLLEERVQQQQYLGSPPGVEPMNDGAPGVMPEETSLQTTFIHLSKTEDEKKYAGLISTKLRELREILRRELRLTVDHEHIACLGVEGDHFRCRDYSLNHPYHFLIVEDSSRGAAVYSLERDLNGESPGRVEAAILDALSRHSKHPLSLHASKEGEKEVGFVRELTISELEHLGRVATKKRFPRTSSISPTELNAIDPQILEMRNSEGLEIEDHRLTIVPSNEVFDQLLQRYRHVFVLFWTNVRSSSAHAFHQFAKLSNSFEKTEHIQLAVVNCHQVDFCVGLNYKDFFTVVAYENGGKVATQELILDEEFYRGWIERIVAGPLIELKSSEEVVAAKKGFLLGKARSAISIATLPSIDDPEFVHIAKIADSIRGRYYLAYTIKPGSKPALATYRPNERKKRVDYSGDFDPPSLLSFLTFSPLPALVDITKGFNSDLLLRQPLPIIIMIAPKSFDTKLFEDFASTPGFAHNKFIYCFIQSEGFKLRDKFLEPLKLENTDGPMFVHLIKNKMWSREINSEDSVAKLTEWISTNEADESQPKFSITYNDPHPLMYLQIETSNRIFGEQPIQPVPDLSVFQIKAQKPLLHDMAKSGSGGGCPFMHGNTLPAHDTQGRHDEL
ncbi:unnamed protein product, partial [Mesorhabditis belari]|uniref:Thioredoxin domain-containing protein n=1 Tax=Mesorhabditis belari TaxID=2138241 RepID=A0AAF3JCE1_9BILA